MTETYESIQAGARGPGVDEWRRVDKARSELAALYRDLAEDGTRTPEYKSERARDAYEKARARVEELAPGDAAYAHHRRIEEVKKAIARGAAEMAWSTRFETDYGPAWDPERRVWTASDGFAYDGKGSEAGDAA